MGPAFLSYSDRPGLRLFLRRIEQRSHLTDAERKAILSLKYEVGPVEAHADFVRLGEPLDHCVLIEAGLVGRFDMLPDGRRQITALHIPGDMADLPSLVVPKAGWALQALTPSMIARIPHQALHEAVSAHPGLGNVLWRDTVVDSSIYSQGVTNVGRRQAIERVAHLWCELGLRYEQAGLADRTAFDLPITQNDLADTLGLTVVHVNRTIQALRRTGAVRTNGRRVEILDWQALVAIAQFDPTYLLLD